MNFDELNTALKGELAAIETFHQAIAAGERESAGDDRFVPLQRMLRDHEDAAKQLEHLIGELGARPATEAGAWGRWSNVVMATANVFGDKAALKALKEGEEIGLKVYQRLAEDSSAPPEVRTLANDRIARNEDHIRELDLMMSAA